MFIVPGVVQADTIYVNGNCGNDDWSGMSPVCEEPDGPKTAITAPPLKRWDTRPTNSKALVSDGAQHRRKE